MRVAIVTNMPTHYRAPLYERIEQQLENKGGHLTVIYAAFSAPDRQWRDVQPTAGATDTRFLNRRPLTLRGRSTYVNPLVVRELRRARPDVVVLGGYAPWIYPGAAWCRLRRVPYLLWNAETVRSAERFGMRIRRRRPLLRLAAGYLAYGPDAAAYLELVGADAARITVVGNGIDIAAFAATAEAARINRAKIRADLGFARPTVLNVGGKGLTLVLAAVRELEGVQLAVIGTRGSVQPGVIDLGRRPSAEMPAIYIASDCLAHAPEFDLWPHAINEALASGLPVVATRDTGVPDDVLSGPGCELVTRSTEALAAGIARALHVDEEQSPELRAEIASPLKPWDVDAMSDRIVSACSSAVAASPRPR